MPRHSPYALLSLNFQFFQFSNKKLSLVCLSLANNWLGYHLLFLEKTFYYSPFLAHCSLPNLNRKDLIIIYWSYKIFSQLSVRFFTFLLFGFQWTFYLSDAVCLILIRTRICFVVYLNLRSTVSDLLLPVLPAGGLKWTRTTDLALIRRAL